MARTIQYFEIFLIKLLNHDNFENIKNVKDLQRANNNVKKNLFFFFYLGFLLRTFTIHGTAGKGGGYLFNFSLPLPPASQTFRH